VEERGRRRGKDQSAAQEDDAVASAWGLRSGGRRLRWPQHFFSQACGTAPSRWPVSRLRCIGCTGTSARSARPRDDKEEAVEEEEEGKERGFGSLTRRLVPLAARLGGPLKTASSIRPDSTRRHQKVEPALGHFTDTNHRCGCSRGSIGGWMFCTNRSDAQGDQQHQDQDFSRKANKRGGR